MKLSDALTVFETRISKSEGGVVTMSPEDLVKYVGEQLALADSEGDAGKERREAVKAVIAAAKAAESAGATSFEVKVFVPAQKAQEPAKDPILEALGALTSKVSNLAESIKAAPAAPAKVEPEKPAAGDTQADVNKAADEANDEANKGNEVAKATKSRVHWPLDLNEKPRSSR